MAQATEVLKETPSQTAGPFLHIGLAPGAVGLDTYSPELGQVIAGPQCLGERIRVEGRVLDAAGAPVTDVLIEVWQANAAGCYNHPEDTSGLVVGPDFGGFGRVTPDFTTGVFSFDTIKPGKPGKPGPVPGSDAPQAPHLNLWLVARGINLGLNTRMYFGDEKAANAADPLLGSIASAARRQTLIAPREQGGTPVYKFDIHLQGASETVFLDI
jgi:protocatechuate 3,4-dioxygenase alpha subunit